MPKAKPKKFATFQEVLALGTELRRRVRKDPLLGRLKVDCNVYRTPKGALLAVALGDLRKPSQLPTHAELRGASDIAEACRKDAGIGEVAAFFMPPIFGVSALTIGLTKPVIFHVSLGAPSKNIHPGIEDLRNLAKLVADSLKGHGPVSILVESRGLLVDQRKHKPVTKIIQ